MDIDLLKKLEGVGLIPNPDAISVGIPRVAEKVVNDEGPAVLMDNERHSLRVELKPLTALFVGNRQPPPMRGEPPPEYFPFFYAVEHAAAMACIARGQPEPDAELERLYRQLRRHPDGKNPNPIFGCLQRAAQVYLSLRDISRAEYEAVMDRLSRSARTFDTHVGSTNYFTRVLEPLLRSSSRGLDQGRD